MKRTKQGIVVKENNYDEENVDDVNEEEDSTVNTL